MRFFNLNLAWFVPGLVAVSAFWGVSACANWYAGASFGTDKAFLFSITTSEVFSVASLSADVLKTVLLFAAASLWYHKNWRPAITVSCMWVVVTCWSVISASGFVAFNQGYVADARGKTAAEWVQLEKQIAAYEAQRSQIPPHRAQKALQAEIDGILRIPGIDGCAVINGPITQKHCPDLTRLQVELGNAERSIWLDGKLEKLREELKSSDRVTSENPWADLIAGLTTASVSQVVTGRAVWFAFMLELISGPGFWVLWAAYASTLRAKPIATVTIPRKKYTPSLTLPVNPETRAVTETPEPPAPTPAPDDGGTPISNPESKPDGSEQSPQNVVNLYEPAVSKRDEKRRKKEIIDRQNRALVSAYVDERLDTEAPSAQITLTAKGGHCQGGTAGSDIYADFRRWCRDSGENPVGKSHFGRFVGEFVDRARNSKGVVYGAVIRTAERKQRAA